MQGSTSTGNPLADPRGFREYDVRWRYPEQIGLEGFEALGLAFGTWLAGSSGQRQVICGRDWRSYAPEVQDAFAAGMVATGLEVLDLGLALSPLVYFAQGHCGGVAGAMITASHNPNGWTGAKLSAAPPLTLSPGDLRAVQAIFDARSFRPRAGGSRRPAEGVVQAYLGALASGPPLKQPLRVVCATGNGAAGAFAPDLLERIGCDVVHRHTVLDDTYPHYNPNPESERMLADMGEAVRESGAAFGLGFDGDGDRCGTVDESGCALYADKLGLLLARAQAPLHPGKPVLADVKSTSLFRTDPVLRAHGCPVQYVRTGHYYMKHALQETGGVFGTERSAHFFFAPPLGGGFDDGLRAAVSVCRMADDAGCSMSELAGVLPPSWQTPSLQPACADTEKYGVITRATENFQRMHAAGERLAGLRITEVGTINGARIELEGGGWALLRASSNTPNLVLMAESLNSEEELNEIRGWMERYLADHHPEAEAPGAGSAH